jgi:hypothetical protein
MAKKKIMAKIMKISKAINEISNESGMAKIMNQHENKRNIKALA